MTKCHSGLVSRSEDDSGPRLAAVRLTGKKCKAPAKKRHVDKHTQEAIDPNKSQMDLVRLGTFSRGILQYDDSIMKVGHRIIQGKHVDIYLGGENRQVIRRLELQFWEVIP